MNNELPQSGVLTGILPAALIVLLTIGFLGAWIMLHRISRSRRAGAPLNTMSFARWAVGSVALWLLFQTLSVFITLATSWPLPVLAILGATAVEAVIALYGFERRAVNPRIGRYITGLRIAAVGLVLLVLAEPVLARFIVRRFERHVVILFDQSDSMHLDDPQRSGRELVELAVFYGILDKRDLDSGENGPDEGGNLLDMLSFAKQEEVERMIDRQVTRHEMAREIIAGEGTGRGLAAALSRDYRVRLLSFAATAKSHDRLEGLEDSDAEGEWSSLTDLAAALEYSLENIPAEQLAGVILLSDCRDTAGGNPEVVASRLGERSAPVFPVLLGSTQPRRDLSITRVEAPESIYKGERLRAEANLKLYGVPGQSVGVRFRSDDDGRVIEERRISVPEDNIAYRTSVSFSDEPEQEGIYSYSIELDTVEGEASEENNTWRFQTAVSEDRTNVLLVDNRPRWEFRYLRNLFYGRDKSVHLQYVLTTPDRIDFPEDRRPVRDPVTASASRPFGEAEADLLPRDLDEWRKFDVIILGDVPPDVLTESALRHIEHCVNDRGAALIVIAGPYHMPHKYDSPILKELLPITYTRTRETHFTGPEPHFRLQLQPTMEGRVHPLMRLAPSTAGSERIWTNLPNLQWRYDAEGVKPGATVLAYAVSPERMREREYLTGGETTEEIAERVRDLAEMPRRNSLIVTHQFGLGRVMMLNFDRTWRLRYRVGDTLHHRFWGQIMTWGAGESLRSGGEFVRLGTDRLTYSPDSAVKAMARVMRPDYTPVTDDSVRVTVYRGSDRISSHNLRYRPDSQGMYDAEIGPFEQPGRYRIVLSGRTADRILQDLGEEAVETEFYVAIAFNPVELAELSADKETAERIAAVSGGEVLRPYEVDRLHGAFGPGTEVAEPERADITLWDHWLMLLALFGLFTTEWLLRRKGGLS